MFTMAKLPTEKARIKGGSCTCLGTLANVINTN